MQEKKNKRLFVLLIVLLVSITAVYWVGREEQSFAPDKKLFNNYESELVDEVLLRSAADTVRLKYNGSRWLVNDQYQADRDMIRVFFATLEKAEPKRPVASSMKDSISNALEVNGVHVTLFTKSTQVANFIAGGNQPKTQSYFKAEDTNQPFVMAIPGYRVYVSGIFELNESGWRDKHVFNLNWQNFSRLDADFKNPEGNFTILMEDGAVKVKDVAIADTARVNGFMDYISLITVDDFVPGSRKLDSLSKTPPFVSFEITDIGGKNHLLTIFPGTGRQQFYGLINKSQWAVFQEDRILPLLRPKEFFIKR
ncbi:MAG TPA: DUF4340 domain-containing protein [Ohtaekwangia sp.]|nr:DUF4340 domain-containing protein [Ohtaekwangia sp.]